MEEEVTVSHVNRVGHRMSYKLRLPKGFKVNEFKFNVIGDVKFLNQRGMTLHFYDAVQKKFIPVPLDIRDFPE